VQGYDRFGNRWQQNSPAGSIYTSNLTFTGNATNNNNRMDLYSYDSAGNLLYDNAHHYFYDAENHLIQVDGSLPYCTSNGASGSAATACYYYDAEGRRIWRTGYTNDNCDNTGKRGYVFDLEGRVIVETNDTGTDCDIQVYAGERHFGRQGGGSFFYHSDWLGTVRKIISDQYLNNSNVQTCTSLPFGDGLTCNSNASNVWHFTGKERDYESGLDNFLARFNAATFGRFLSPDPESAGASDDNPQTWNAYAYAIDNPIGNIDPDGRDACDNSTAGGGCVVVTADAPGDEVTYSYSFRRIMLRQLGDAAQRANDYLRYAWDWWRTSRVDSTCVAAAAAAGAAIGASQGPVVGGVLGLAGGPAAEVTVPGGAALGAAVGGAAGGGIGTGVGWIVCRTGAPGGGGSGGSNSGGQRLTNSQAKQAAKELGYDTEVKDPPFDSHGNKVFTNGKNLISADRDVHSGGVWKMYDSSGNRLGTYDANLNRIGN